MRAILSLFLLAATAESASMYLAKLCSGQTCSDPKFPMLDFDPRTNKCICSAHPCWDDSGLTHTCKDPRSPYLSFSYSDTRQLQCGCSKQPQVGSNFIALHKC